MKNRPSDGAPCWRGCEWVAKTLSPKNESQHRHCHKPTISDDEPELDESAQEEKNNGEKIKRFNALQIRNYVRWV